MKSRNLSILIALFLSILGIGVAWLEVLLLLSMFWNGYEPLLIIPIIAIIVIYIFLWFIFIRRIKN